MAVRCARHVVRSEVAGTGSKVVFWSSLVRILGGEDGSVMAGEARREFARRFAALLDDSGLKARDVPAKVNGRRPPRSSWRVTQGLLSAWKTGRNLPSEANWDSFLMAVRVLTEGARRRAAAGHPVQQLLDEGDWADLYKKGRASAQEVPPPGEVMTYLKHLAGWLNTDPWPQDARFGGPVLTPESIEQKLTVDGGRLGPDDLDADELAGRCARLVVLGGPGSGKTWLARRSARICAATALERLAAGEAVEDVELPLYTTCARLSAMPPGDDIRRAVVSSALSQLPDLGGARVNTAIRELFAERDAPTLLVLDSLDESPGPDDRIRQADTLPAAWRIVLTSRPVSWDGQLAITAGDPARIIGTLQPLRYPDDVESFIARWFAPRPEWAAALSTQLRENPALQQLATVPLMLAFCCILGGGEPLPARRADLYAKVINRLLTGRWRGSGHGDPDVIACMEILRGWAWRETGGHRASSEGAWSEEFLTPRISNHSDREALDHVAVPLRPADVDTGMALRRFVHRSVQEHLVAEHLASRPAGEAAGILLEHLWYDPEWADVAPAALIRHPDRDQVLRALIRRITADGGSGTDLSAVDGCWEIRRFLARVASESGQDDWPSWASELITQARTDLAVSGHGSFGASTRDWPGADRRIAQAVLARLDGETSGYDACRLVRAVRGLNPTGQEIQTVREILLRMLTSGTDSSARDELGYMISELGATAEERALARAALIAHIMSSRIMIFQDRAVSAVVALTVTEQERTQVRDELTRLTFARPHPVLSQVVARLTRTETDPELRRAVLLSRLASIVNLQGVLSLGEEIAGLDPSAEELAQVRAALFSSLAAGVSSSRLLGTRNSRTLSPGLR